MSFSWKILFIVLFVSCGAFYPRKLFAQQPMHTPRVLFIGYDPTDVQGRSLANTYFYSHLEGKTAEQFEPIFTQRTVDTFRNLSQGRIAYDLVGIKRITSFPTYPDGFKFTVDSYRKCVFGDPTYDPVYCDNRKWSFPYVQWIADNQICEDINRLQVDELWILSDPYIAAYESFMIGPTNGFFVNGPSFVTPVCNKHVIAVNGTYERPDPFAHSYGHRVESVMSYVTTNWSYLDYFNYWERFSAMSSVTRALGIPYCGNVHFPFNARQEYDYSNTTSVTNTCNDFANFPNYTNQTQTNSCSLWGCTESGWEMYWMASLPHNSGEFQMTSTLGRQFSMKKDWWYYILYPENAIYFVTNFANPSPSPTISPNPPFPGDANGDRHVDGVDFVIWLSHYGQSITGPANGDFNSNGKVDGVDYVIWLGNYGR